MNWIDLAVAALVTGTLVSLYHIVINIADIRAEKEINELIDKIDQESGLRREQIQIIIDKEVK